MLEISGHNSKTNIKALSQKNLYFNIVPKKNYQTIFIIQQQEQKTS